MSDTTNMGPQLLLPRNLGALAKCTAKGEQLRYGATTGVQLEATTDGYRATVTDGRQLVTVEGTHPADREQYPTWPALASAPNSGTCNVIGGSDWAAAFKAIPKQGRAFRKPILDNLAVVLGSDVTTLASTDLSGTNVAQPINLTRLVTKDGARDKQPDQRFPNWRHVMPIKAPVFSIAVDPSILIQVLTTVREFTAEDTKRVNLEFFHPDHPFRITASTTEQKCTAVIVPLTISPTAPKRKHSTSCYLPEKLPAVLRTVAQLMRVWTVDGRPMIEERCKRAHVALTAKYLS